jgi:mannose-6-phosphate isomerase-like protein (cupin superfamily)
VFELTVGGHTSAAASGIAGDVLSGATFGVELEESAASPLWPSNVSLEEQLPLTTARGAVHSDSLEEEMELVNLPRERDAIAPDGAEVRLLATGECGSMAHFELGSGETSVAIAHRTLEELWFFLSGEGEMWLRAGHDAGSGSVLKLHADAALRIPARAHFQFRSFGSESLTAVGVTMPPWPGEGDLSGKGEVILVEGPWTATVPSGMD